MTRPFALRLSLALMVLATAAFGQADKPEAGGEKKKDPAFDPVVDQPGLPRVLLIGDSISIGYTPAVREALAGIANVHRIPENGGSTRDALKKLDAWLKTDGGGKWDVIHCNWGLHDLKHWKDGKLDLAGAQVTPVELYQDNLRELIARLIETGAKVIFATTTPVPDGSEGREAGDELGYNQAARDIMAEAKVPINDLHATAQAQLAKIQRPKNVHFTPEGSKVLGEQVAAEIKKALGK
jgi:lysophospholipase L1-like esterase